MPWWFSTLACLGFLRAGPIGGSAEVLGDVERGRARPASSRSRRTVARCGRSSAIAPSAASCACVTRVPELGRRSQSPDRVPAHVRSPSRRPQAAAAAATAADVATGGSLNTHAQKALRVPCLSRLTMLAGPCRCGHGIGSPVWLGPSTVVWPASRHPRSLSASDPAHDHSNSARESHPDTGDRCGA